MAKTPVVDYDLCEGCGTCVDSALQYLRWTMKARQWSSIPMHVIPVTVKRQLIPALLRL